MQTTESLLQAQIAKVDTDRQIVFGWASVSVGKDGELLVDRQDDVIYPEDLEAAAYDFVLNSRNGDTMHDEITKAYLVESVIFTRDKLEKMGLGFINTDVQKADTDCCMWWTGFYVADDEVWKGVKNGTYTAFSIGGRAVREPLGPQGKA
jgi:hypothetical protein